MQPKARVKHKRSVGQASIFSWPLRSHHNVRNAGRKDVHGLDVFVPGALFSQGNYTRSDTQALLPDGSTSVLVCPAPNREDG